MSTAKDISVYVLVVVCGSYFQISTSKHLAERHYEDLSSQHFVELVHQPAGSMRHLKRDQTQLLGIQNGMIKLKPDARFHQSRKKIIRRSPSEFLEKNNEEGQSGIATLQETLSNLHEAAMQHVMPTPPPEPRFHPATPSPRKTYPLRLCLRRERLPGNFRRGKARSRLCRMLRRTVKSTHTTKPHFQHKSASTKHVRKLRDDRRRSYRNRVRRPFKHAAQQNVNNYPPKVQTDITNYLEPMTISTVPENVINAPYSTKELSKGNDVSVTIVQNNNSERNYTVKKNETLINLTKEGQRTHNAAFEFKVELVGNATFNNTQNSKLI